MLSVNQCLCGIGESIVAAAAVVGKKTHISGLSVGKLAGFWVIFLGRKGQAFTIPSIQYYCTA